MSKNWFEKRVKELGYKGCRNGGDEGLLELMSNGVNGGEPIGYLTAEECMAYVRGEKDGDIH